MKIKELIAQLQLQNPDDDIFVHQYDDYHISTNIKVQEVFRDDLDDEELACFVDNEDEIFKNKVLLLTVEELIQWE